MPTLHEAAAMETPAPSSVATAVPRTSPPKPTTLQMETPLPSASQLARALELGAKLTAASPVSAPELGISSSWNRMSTETVEQAQFRDLLHTSKLIRPASAIPDNEPELPPPPSPPASPSFLLGGAAAALAADEEEPTPLQSTIVSVANVCAAHPSEADEGMVRAASCEKSSAPARLVASAAVRSVRTPLGVIRSSSRYAPLSLS